MREIVIVPTWQRPDFLAATLERLCAADEGQQHYLIAIDRQPDGRIRQIANQFTRRLGATRVKVVQRMHTYRGNSFNVLHSYREVLDANYEMIHLVEEDVFVADDYFAYHRAAHRLVPNIFAVSGARNQNYANDPSPQPGAIYLAPQYQSIAVSFRAKMLALVLEHATHQYYRNPIEYCRRTFPRTGILASNAEQDGLIGRIVEKNNFRVAYPTIPVAYHAGFIGYHRAGESVLTPGKPIQGAAAELLNMDSTELNRRAYSYPDHYAIDVRAKHAPPDRVTYWPMLV